MGDGGGDESGERHRLPTSIDDLIDEVSDHVAELIVLLDEDGGILWFNRPALMILGWELDHWVGRNIVEVLHPDEVGVAIELLVSARATGPGTKEPVTYRIASVHDGWLTIEAIASNVPLESGRTVLVCSARIARQARRSEFIVGEVDERRSIVFDEAVVGMAHVGLDGRILKANRRLAEQVGQAPADLHGVALSGLVAPADRPALTRALAECEETRKPGVVRARLGDLARRFDVHLSVVPDWVGEPLYLFVQFAP